MEFRDLLDRTKITAKANIRQYKLKKYKARFEKQCSELVDQTKSVKVQLLEDLSQQAFQEYIETLSKYKISMQRTVRIRTSETGIDESIS
jgi:hypothetical protein